MQHILCAASLVANRAVTVIQTLRRGALPVTYGGNSLHSIATD